MLIVVFGLPGTGKSYFASKLADRLGAGYFSSDKIRKEETPNPEYTEEARLAIYKQLFDRALHYLENGETVVVDATFHKKDVREKLCSMASANGFSICFIEITAPEAIIKMRTGRKREYSDANFRIYELIREKFEPMQERHVVLESGENNIESMLVDAIRYIRSV